MSLATASCDLWQNEQRSVSSGVLGFTVRLLQRAGRFIFPNGPAAPAYMTFILFVLVNDIVDDPVFFGLQGVHNEVALHVFFHLFQFLPRMFGNKLAGDFPHPQNLSSMYINICGLATKARHQGLMNKNPRSG